MVELPLAQKRKGEREGESSSVSRFFFFFSLFGAEMRGLLWEGEGVGVGMATSGRGRFGSLARYWF